MEQSKITVKELNFREQCAVAWNNLTMKQQEKYHCLGDFVKAYCSLVKEQFDEDAIDRICDYVYSHDFRSYERFVRVQRELGNRKW